MTVSLHAAGVPKDMTGGSVHVGGALKTLTEGLIRVSGSLKEFYSQIAISLDKYGALGIRNSAGTAVVTSESVTAIVTGAIGTVTHSWTKTSGGSWTITNPTGATTQFSISLAPNTDAAGTFIDTVTDQAGQTIASLPVGVTCTNDYFGGGGGGGGPYP